MMLIEMQQAELLAHRVKIDLTIQPYHGDQIQFFLLRLNFHMLPEFHEEALHQLGQAFH